MELRQVGSLDVLKLLICEDDNHAEERSSAAHEDWAGPRLWAAEFVFLVDPNLADICHHEDLYRAGKHQLVVVPGSVRLHDCYHDDVQQDSYNRNNRLVASAAKHKDQRACPNIRRQQNRV